VSRLGLVLALMCALFGWERAAASDVWLDVDVGAGVPGRDVDDALAMIQTFHSPELTVRGVSAVYGNAPLKDGLPVARELAEKFGPPGLGVYAGAARASELGESNDAVAAMAAALAEKPMTILALGPVTNVGSLLRLHPDVATRIDSIVMVAARRPGQRFTYPDNPGGPFRDFNFENDVEAMRILLESEIDLVFAPWEVSSHVWITDEDLERLRASGGSGAWIAEKSQSWIAMWRDQLGQEGFNPFDTLAVGWLTHPELIESMRVGVWIASGPDDTVAQDGARVRDKAYLLVDAAREETRSALYLVRPARGFKDFLIKRLAGREYR